MTRLPRALKGLGRVALAATAAAGAVCLVLTVLALATGTRPLVFRSGSMSPGTPAGSLGFARSVTASQIQVGDVVTVRAASGTRVTHRVVALTRHGGEATLRLKGDANTAPDAELYPVRNAQRLWFSVPRAGYAVAWLSHAPGSYLLALYVALMLLLVGRRRSPDPGDLDQGAGSRTPEPKKQLSERGKRRRSRDFGAIGATAAVLALGIAVLTGWGSTTWATWSDAAAVSGTTLSTGTFDSQAPTTTIAQSPAANGNGWNSSNVAFTFTPTDPPGGSGVQKVEYKTNSNGAGFGSITTLTASPYTGTISAEGTTVVEYWATDYAGNAESPHNTYTVKIDKTAPPAGAIAFTATQNGAGWRSSGAFTLSGSDTGASASGVDHYEYKIDGGSYVTGASGTIADGTHTITYRTVDQAGNLGAETATTVNVDSANPSGAITFPGANNDLNNANQWGTNCRNASNTAVAGWCGTASDAPSGVASVTYEIKKTVGSTITCWNPTTSTFASTCGTVRTAAAGPTTDRWVVPMTYAQLGSGGGASFTMTVTVTDNAGRTSTATKTVS